MTRVIRTELRRSASLVTALLMLALAAAHIGTIYDYWRASAVLAGHELATGLSLLLPLAAACGAMVGRREIRVRAVELLESTGRPRWQRFLPSTAALGIAVAGPYLLVGSVCLVLVAAGGGMLDVAGGVLPVIAALTLTGAAWLGIAAGRAWSSPVLPPLLAAALLVVQARPPQLTGAYDRWSNLTFTPEPAPATVWETPTAAALLARLALAAGLVIAGLLLIAGRSWLSRAGAGVVLAAGLAGLVLIAAPGPAGHWRLEPSAQRLVCADGEPEVCVTAAHAYLLPQVVPEVRRGLAALAVLPGAPTRAAEIRLHTIGDHSSEQWYRFAPYDEPGTVYFVVDYSSTEGGDPGVAARIAMGGGTYLTGCGAQEDVPLMVAGAWLLGTGDFRVWEPGFGYWGWSDLQPEVRERLRALRELPKEEQLARVTAVRDAAARCEPDLMARLTGEVPA
ncbi:hypothetical protein [Catenuloplanes indicus]|uniref:Uncharacterized protein n=1 Tax=Catenuloplanes indicus TaxID=137267 RepID=A0AAE3VUZ3_9ACTN|nr:hypothetical protein [Catenuloplanes indicus]MDQ0364130.1 hypothetical protein [Catenuloplanes indicus]